MRVMNGMTAPNGDLLPRHGDVHPHLEEPALAMMLVRRLDRDVTADDVRAESVQPGGKLPNARFERWRGFHVLERDLQWQWHGRTPLVWFANMLSRPHGQRQSASLRRRGRHFMRRLPRRARVRR